MNRVDENIIITILQCLFKSGAEKVSDHRTIGPRKLFHTALPG